MKVGKRPLLDDDLLEIAHGVNDDGIPLLRTIIPTKLSYTVAGTSPTMRRSTIDIDIRLVVFDSCIDPRPRRRRPAVLGRIVSHPGLSPMAPAEGLRWLRRCVEAGEGGEGGSSVSWSSALQILQTVTEPCFESAVPIDRTDQLFALLIIKKLVLHLRDSPCLPSRQSPTSLSQSIILILSSILASRSSPPPSPSTKATAVTSRLSRSGTPLAFNTSTRYRQHLLHRVGSVRALLLATAILPIVLAASPLRRSSLAVPRNAARHRQTAGAMTAAAVQAQTAEGPMAQALLPPFPATWKVRRVVSECGGAACRSMLCPLARLEELSG